MTSFPHEHWYKFRLRKHLSPARYFLSAYPWYVSLDADPISHLRPMLKAYWLAIFFLGKEIGKTPVELKRNNRLGLMGRALE
tara:strand:+ start:692 stop:937 length:246 start_codon:yes stop_codon:yes gene_type:complete